MNGRLTSHMLLCLFTLVVGRVGFATEAETTARDILRASGVRGGIIVHLGATSAELTVALRANQSYLVHALAGDPSHVDAIRHRAEAAGLAAAVSAEMLHGNSLPYVDNLINLVVVEQEGQVPRSEIMRVLAPHGVACFAEAGKWVCRIKPRPDTMDQWTHYLHDAGNNAVAEDELVGPPRSLQWGAAPLWLRSHETPSGIQSPVSADGRLFYIFDEGLIGITDERLSDHWSLICRDAFNGKLLWKRPFAAWGWREWSREKYAGKDWTQMRARRTDVPEENQQRVVAYEDRVYTTLSYRAPMSILDAATGEVLHTVEETAPTREILVSDHVALTYSQDQPSSSARRRGEEELLTGRLVAVDTKSGKVLWQKPCETIRPMALTINQGLIVYCSGKDLIGWKLQTGETLWRITMGQTSPRTLVTADEVTVVYGSKRITAYDARHGVKLWQQDVKPIGGAEGVDLFVIDGVVWRGLETVDEQAQPARKSPNALATGWDLHTGKETRRVFAKNLRSPEHHHRCYRNKATSRYIISAMEGAEFMDLIDDEHSQDNWLRGSCRSGVMPCNGMLYVPPDQCFCEPGAKLLGYTAVTARRPLAGQDVPEQSRLLRGPAFGAVSPMVASVGSDWPTLRHDPARRGSTMAEVPAEVSMRWNVKLTGRLTAPVMAAGMVFVAQQDCHRLVALDAATGNRRWEFTANGRLDSPPTFYDGLVLFGSCDGYVYCLRAQDGALVWRFLAAPRDQRIAYFDQLESSWPVHGSVLVDRGVAYCTAGRSTYLDGGIHVYALEPQTGEVQHHTVLQGPFPDDVGQRDVSFYVLGANSDVLVSEGGSIYMRQKKLTPELEEVSAEVLSSKGEQNVGLHVFSTAGLLDGSWYNRTFWMYSQRWPGFQLANQAPKSGQLLVVDQQRTYSLRVFYRRNVHTPMFFPGREGYLLFADENTTEPQIVGEAGARPPLHWLPQSDYSRARGDEMRKLESVAFGLDKMIGYTRADPPAWTCWLPVRVRGMVKAGAHLFVAGAPDVLDSTDQLAAFEGRRGARLVTLRAADGKVASETELAAPPVFDGMIAASDCLYISLTDGSIVCFGKPQ